MRQYELCEAISDYNLCPQPCFSGKKVHREVVEREYELISQGFDPYNKIEKF